MANGFYIEIVTADSVAQYMPFTSKSLLIGRSPQRCELVLNDTRVSRLHLRIARHPETGVTITDMYSANGSTLDGRPLPPGIPIHWLMKQTVVVGNTRLILNYGNLDPSED